MLYIYDFCDDFYADITGHEPENDEETLLEAIKDCKELKPYDNDCLWISKSETVVLNGKELKATDKFYAYVDKGWFWDESDFVKITTDFTDGGLEITKARASELLSDDLSLGDEGQYKYEERIWNAEEPDEEISAILKELGLVVFDMFIQEINQAYESVKNNGFEWE